MPRPYELAIDKSTEIFTLSEEIPLTRQTILRYEGGMNIRQMIRERGLKQAWVASQIGIGEAHFSEIARGIKRLPIEKAQPLADVLQVPVADVVRAASDLAA
jgi:predicted XRE-type DNA-binding protein